jgi:hypothetical protein
MGKLLAFDVLGSGVSGSVYDSMCHVNGQEEQCATKVNEHRFGTFPMEIEAHEYLGRKPFCTCILRRICRTVARGSTRGNCDGAPG